MKGEPLFELNNSNNGSMQDRSKEPWEVESLDDPNRRDSNSNNLTESSVRKSAGKGVSKRHYEIEGFAFIISPQDDNESKNVNEALSCPAKDEWVKAMEEEMESMDSNHVWKLVDLPFGRKSIGNKWVLKLKCKADRTIERYKSRLVAKGYTQ